MGAGGNPILGIILCDKIIGWWPSDILLKIGAGFHKLMPFGLVSNFPSEGDTDVGLDGHGPLAHTLV